MLQIGRQYYPSDLSNQQWKLISKLLPSASRQGRPRKIYLRQVVSAIFYVNRTGCAWRYLPNNFPHWRTVYDYYRQWQRKGIIEKIHFSLVKKVRVADLRPTTPSKCIIDSQASKAHWGEARGFDGFKKVRGRKRNIVVDTLGLIHDLRVDSAFEKDHRSAIKMFTENPEKMRAHLPRLKEIYADGGYRGDFSWFVQTHYGAVVNLNSSKNIRDAKQSKIIMQSNLKPVRWIVERTFAWFNHFRRLSRDYEKSVASSKAMIFLAMIQIMLNRLTAVVKRPRWN